MNPLFVTLCGDGTSDRMLLPIVRWTLDQHLSADTPINIQFSARPGAALPARLRAALAESSECGLLIVHRDTETSTPEARAAEIAEAVAGLAAAGVELPPHVAVIPVRMSEAWLLFDEGAVRRAAGNTRGKVRIELPARGPDRIADPKTALNNALDAASERAGRKLRQFQRDRSPARVAAEIEDFSPLRRLAAFQAFEADVAAFARLRASAG